MKRWFLALMVVAITTGATAAEDRSAADALAMLDRFAGEWEVHGKWADGKPLNARGVYAWGLDKKIFKTQTFVRDGDREYQRYEGIMAWHPEKKSLFQISFGCDGTIGENLIEIKDKDTLHVGWKPYHPDKPSGIRQVVQFVDHDHFRWIISVRQGDGWQQIMDATWGRKAK